MLSTLALWVVCSVGVSSAWWAELLRFVPFPAHLAPALLALVVSGWLRWPWRLSAAACVALVLMGVMDLKWGRADSGQGSFRLMTWNVKAFHHTRTPERDHLIALELLEHSPDVLVMQDAIDLTRPDTPLPEPIALALRGYTLFRHDQYLVASRLPLAACRAQPMPVRDEPREFVRCVLRVGEADIDLVTAHLLSPREGLNAARWEWLDGGLDDWEQNYRDRLMQSATLVRHLAGNPRPMIVAGDLNAAEDSPVVRSLKDLGLRDAFASAGHGYGYTHGHSLKPRFSFLRIDHVLVSRDIGVRDAFTGGREASEHRPVIADLLARRD